MQARLNGFGIFLLLAALCSTVSATIPLSGKLPYWICFLLIGILTPWLALLRKPGREAQPKRVTVAVWGVFCFVVFSRFVWWNPYFHQNLWGWLVFAGAWFWLDSVLLKSGDLAEGDRSYDRWDGISLGVLAIFSFRSDALFSPSAMHHWSAYLGPAEMVRQGGLLLWDIPSQYGFLPSLLLAHLPFRSLWNGMFILQGIFCFLCSAVTYSFLRDLFRWGAARPLALLLTLALVLLLPGWPEFLEGVAAYPSSGPLRFWPIYLLLFCIRDERWRLGHAVWAIALLWSFESAVYASCVWLPVWILHSWRRAELAIPLLVAGVMFGSVELLYRVSYGISPRWSTLVEYVRAFGGEFGAQVPSTRGAVWAQLLHFSLLASGLGSLWYRASTKSRPIVLATWMAAWCSVSYFLGNIHDNNLLNVIAISFPALALVLCSTQNPYIRRAYVALLAILLTCVYGNLDAWQERLENSWRSGWGSVEGRRLPPPAEVLNLLASARLHGSDPFSSWDEEYGYSLFTGQPSWLPTQVFPLARPLSPEAFRGYLERFWMRMPTHGWLLTPRTPHDPVRMEALVSLIEETHQGVQEYLSPNFRLVRYQPRKSVSH